jgi:hypothetical protein
MYGVILLTLLAVGVWQITPGLSGESAWRLVAQSAPPALLQQLQQDYALHIPPNQTIDVGQMHILKLQQTGSLPLYLINTRIHPVGHPEQTPTCGIGGCLFLGYIPHKDKYQQVLNVMINDFQLKGNSPIIQPLNRVLNDVPCFQLTTSNANTGRIHPTQTLCFNGHTFVEAGEELKGHSKSEK